MTNAEIIENIANDKLVEEIINGIYTPTEKKIDLQDLTQDIYLILFEMDNEKLHKLFQTKQLRFYVTRLLMNNIFSKTSKYFYRYKKPTQDTYKINQEKLHKNGLI